MMRLATVLVALASCVAWNSRLTITQMRHVRIDAARGGECVQRCQAPGAVDAPGLAPCLARCPGSIVEHGGCGTAEPGTCAELVETSTVERDGRCAELVQLDAAITVTGCSEVRHVTAIGTIGTVIGIAALVFLSLLRFAAG